MIVAFTLPHRSTGDALKQAAGRAQDRGADAIVIAEAPLGRWASSPQAAAFLASAVTVPVGVALNGRSRDPLQIGADISLLQRVMSQPSFFIIGGLDVADLDSFNDQLDRVRPPLLPFGSSIWMLGEERDATREIGAKGLSLVGARSKTNALSNGIWLDVDAHPRGWDGGIDCRSLLVLSTASAEGIELEPSELTRLKYPAQANSKWLKVGLAKTQG